MYRNPNSSKYLESSVNTASPAKLVEMLYQNSIERLEKTKKLIKNKDLSEANKQIIRVQDIITELNVSLDLKAGGDISKNLRSLYNYMNRRLVEANIKKDLEILEEVKIMIKDLLETWREAMIKAKDTVKDLNKNSHQSKFDVQT
ncbi:MAG: flagellar export chaperone FliS [Thermotogota bacterium]